jgi:GT2 family glycosyltransferase
MKISNVNPLVSVIITNYNGKIHLKECLDSLERIDYDNYEIILVDNASTDGSVEFAKTISAGLKILSLEKNYGFAEGCNLGAQEAKGEFIVFLNNDTRVDVGWLSELVNATKIYGENNIFSSKVLFYDPPHKINTIGGLITPMGSGFDINFGKPDLKEFNQVRYVGSPSGCSMLLKRSVFQQMGGFDKDYFAFLEDVDFGWRCWLAGYKTYYIPTSVVYHKYGSTGGKRESPFRVFNVQKNHLSNMLKNFYWRNLIPGFIISLIFDLVRIFSFLIKGNFDLISAVFRGDYIFLRELPDTLAKRKYIQENRKLSDKEMVELGLIVTLNSAIQEYRRLGQLK